MSGFSRIYQNSGILSVILAKSLEFNRFRPPSFVKTWPAAKRENPTHAIRQDPAMMERRMEVCLERTTQQTKILEFLRNPMTILEGNLLNLFSRFS
jgi:hypothetical protein